MLSLKFKIFGNILSQIWADRYLECLRKFSCDKLYSYLAHFTCVKCQCTSIVIKFRSILRACQRLNLELFLSIMRLSSKYSMFIRKKRAYILINILSTVPWLLSPDQKIIEKQHVEFLTCKRLSR